MASRKEPKKINLALQGGGAHGALCWGVLDQLCQDERVEIDGFSATSAGAMNAVVYAYGNMTGGREGARQLLEAFWRDVSFFTSFAEPHPLLNVPPFSDAWNKVQVAMSYFFMDNFTRAFSPYEFNPLNVNPLRDILLRHVDFSKLPDCKSTKMFICATNVRTNKIKIFKNEEISVDAVMASACLPQLFQAVEIGGEAYWDGGYMGNPAIYPLIYNTGTEDIVIVHINPIVREDVPRTTQDILNRVNEISFNSSLLREMRAIEFAKRLVEEDMIKDEYRDHFHFNHLYMHSIRADEVMREYTVTSKTNPDWDFLVLLRDQGRLLAKNWLDTHIDDIGKRSTINLREIYE